VADTSAAPAGEIAATLLARGETLAVAETAAGGLISAALVQVPGASAWFLGSAVAYSATAKASWLNLPTTSFAPDGVVSRRAAARLAEAVRERLGATWGLAEAGVAGPQTGRRSAKPAGLVYVAVAGPAPASLEVTTGLDDRAANQRAFAAAALGLLVQALREATSGESRT
jgi:nicotinamide-nucleotide amidase